MSSRKPNQPKKPRARPGPKEERLVIAGDPRKVVDRLLRTPKPPNEVVHYRIRQNTNAVTGAYFWRRVAASRRYRRGDEVRRGDLGIDFRARVTLVEEGDPPKITIEPLGAWPEEE